MPRRCCVVGCKSNYDGEPYTTVYSFPKDPDRRVAWLNAIQRENYEPGSRAVVCIKHFDERCLVRVDCATRADGTQLVLPRQVPKLVEDAFPSIFPIVTPSSSSEDSKTKGKSTTERKTTLKIGKKVARRSRESRPGTSAVNTFEEIQPAHPLPTADISPLALQPTRLRMYKPTVPRYEDVSQIVSKFAKTKNPEPKPRRPRCRLCMAESRAPMVSIFRGSVINNIGLATRIFSVTEILVEDGDGLPSVICQPCNKNIVNWYDFKQVCIASDAKYRREAQPKDPESIKKKSKSSTPVDQPDGDEIWETECPVEVKVEIEEHDVFEASGGHYLDASNHEETLPAFVSVKVEPEGMWHPEVSLAEGGGVVRDPLSLPTPPPPPDKATSYLIALKPVSAPTDEPPTYLLAINNAPCDDDEGVANLPVLTNVPANESARASALPPSFPRPITLLPPDLKPFNLTPSVPRPITLLPPDLKPISLTPPDLKPISLTPSVPRPINLTSSEPRLIALPPLVSRPITLPQSNPRPISTSSSDSTPMSLTPLDPRPISAIPLDPRPINVTSSDSRPKSMTPLDPRPISTSSSDSTPISLTPLDPGPINMTPSNAPAKRDGDPLEGDGASKKSKSGPGVD